MIQAAGAEICPLSKSEKRRVKYAPPSAARKSYYFRLMSRGAKVDVMRGESQVRVCSELCTVSVDKSVR